MMYAPVLKPSVQKQMNYKVVISPFAKKQLDILYDYIAQESSDDIAERYIEEISSYCESLNIFPLRGTLRNDLRAGLRITSYKKRVVIAFEVEGSQVTILSISYGGQDYESLLSGDDF